MLFASGYIVAGRYRGVPLMLHWTIPVSMMVLGGFAFAPFTWVAILALILLHEAGQVVFIRSYGLRLVATHLHGLGGVPRWTGTPALSERVAIAWSGVLAQLLAFLIVRLLVLALGAPEARWLVELVDGYTHACLWMVALNLLPLPGFDGEVAWLILPAYRRRLLAQDREERGPRLHVVDRYDPPSARDIERTAHDIERQIQELADAHNERAMADEDGGDTGP